MNFKKIILLLLVFGFGPINCMKRKPDDKEEVEKDTKKIKSNPLIDRINLAILEGTIDNVIDETGNTLLFLAVNQEDIQAIKLLIKSKANLNMQNNNGNTALIETLIKNMDANNSIHINTEAKIKTYDNTIKIINLLIEAKANLNISNNNMDTMLTIAISKGASHNTIALILNSGQIIDINAKNNNGNTPLIIASKHSYYTIIELLIEKGADLDIQNLEGNTALIVAALNNRDPSIIETLIKNNAKIQTLNNKNEEALTVVLNKNNTFYNTNTNKKNTDLLLLANLKKHNLENFIQKIKQLPESYKETYISGLDNLLKEHTSLCQDVIKNIIIEYLVEDNKAYEYQKLIGD